MEENQAPLEAQSRSTDLFSDKNNEILNTTQAASICGVSYHKFLREFGEIPYSFVYPGGPRIYMRSEVRAFIDGKNKWETMLRNALTRGSIPLDVIGITPDHIPSFSIYRVPILNSHGNAFASNGRSGRV